MRRAAKIRDDSNQYLISILHEQIVAKDRTKTDHATANASHSWTGSEAVNIICATQNNLSRDVATSIGQMLLEEGHFHAVNGSACFEDGSALYRFKENRPMLLPMKSFDMLSNALSWLFTASEENVKHALSLACQRNDGKQVRKIIGEQSKVDVDCDLNDHGWTALHVAAKYGAVDVMHVLVNDLGADVNVDTANVPDVGDAFTALMIGAVNGRLAVVSTLCEEFHADHLITNDKGQTAMELAYAHGHKVIYRYLTTLLEFSPSGRMSRHGSTSTSKSAERRRSSGAPPPSLSVVGAFGPSYITPIRDRPAQPPINRKRRTSHTLTPDWGRRTSATLFWELDDTDDEKVEEGNDNRELSKSAEMLEDIVATQEQELRQLRTLLRQRSHENDELKSHMTTLETRLDRAASEGALFEIEKEFGIDYYDDDVGSDFDLM